ncbi:hypothetical protein IWZ01DRAFT_481050 [Phyllosticta capitalensis]
MALSRQKPVPLLLLAQMQEELECRDGGVGMTVGVVEVDVDVEDEVVDAVSVDVESVDEDEEEVVVGTAVLVAIVVVGLLLLLLLELLPMVDDESSVDVVVFDASAEDVEAVRLGVVSVLLVVLFTETTGKPDDGVGVKMCGYDEEEKTDDEIKGGVVVELSEGVGCKPEKEELELVALTLNEGRATEAVILVETGGAVPSNEVELNEAVGETPERGTVVVFMAEVTGGAVPGNVELNEGVGETPERGTEDVALAKGVANRVVEFENGSGVAARLAELSEGMGAVPVKENLVALLEGANGDADADAVTLKGGSEVEFLPPVGNGNVELTPVVVLDETARVCVVSGVAVGNVPDVELVKGGRAVGADDVAAVPVRFAPEIDELTMALVLGVRVAVMVVVCVKTLSVTVITWIPVELGWAVVAETFMVISNVVVRLSVRGRVFGKDVGLDKLDKLPLEDGKTKDRDGVVVAKGDVALIEGLGETPDETAAVEVGHHG